jgi:hypothetical protein
MASAKTNSLKMHNCKQPEFFALAIKFREACDAAEAARLGDQLGKLIFG